MKSFLCKGNKTLHLAIQQLKEDETKLIIICNAGVNLKLKTQEISLSERNILILSPWTKFSLQSSTDKQPKIQLISFLLYEVMQLDQSLFFHTSSNSYLKIALSQKQFIYVSHLMRVLHYNLNYIHSAHDSVYINRYLLNSILLAIDNAYYFNQIGKIDVHLPNFPILHKFFFLANKHFKTHHNVHFYAANLGITTRYLANIVKEATHKTPKSILNNLINQEAIVLILEDNYNLNEISDQLGFNSYPSFLIFFKKINGLSPSQYRTKFLNKKI